MADPVPAAVAAASTSGRPRRRRSARRARRAAARASGARRYPHGHRGRTGAPSRTRRDWWSALAAAVRQRGPRGRRGAGDLRRRARGRRWWRPTTTGVPVRPAITWQDRRPGDTGFGLLPRMAWLAREDPAAAMRAVWLLPAWDALGLWLTGEAATSLAGARGGARRRRPWRRPACGRRQVPAARGRSGRCWARCGRCAAAALGLRAGHRRWSAGVNDGAASMLGAGPAASRATPWTRAATSGGHRDLRRPARSAWTGCTARRRRCPGAGSWAGRWPRWARRWTGCGSALLGDRWTLEELFAEAAAGARRAPTGSCSCRTWPGSGRRSSTRGRAARSSG